MITKINYPEYFRFPAEWEPQAAVLLSWPHGATDWAYMLPEARDCFKRIAQAISPLASLIIVTPEPWETEKDLKGLESPIKIVETPTNDTWARDFGMITLLPKEVMHYGYALDFTFNGWGLKFPACYDNQINATFFEGDNAPKYLDYFNCKEFVLEGGSIDTDGQGTILTTKPCLLSANRNGWMDQESIELMLKSMLCCDRVLWLSHGYLAGDDTDGHVDTLARFISPTAIAYSSCDRPNDENSPELAAMEEELKALRTVDGKPYDLVPLPIPHPIYGSGERLPATYANFLMLNGSLLLPVYGDSHYDAIAIDALTRALPSTNIIPIDCRALIHQHGSLHCVTMQIPEFTSGR